MRSTRAKPAFAIATVRGTEIGIVRRALCQASNGRKLISRRRPQGPSRWLSVG